MQEVRVKKRMWPVERHAMEIYTSKVYDLFCEELDKSKSYDVLPNDNFTTFTVRHTAAEHVERYKRPQFEVMSINNGERYSCDCGLYEHFGVVCCHVLRVSIILFTDYSPDNSNDKCIVVFTITMVNLCRCLFTLVSGKYLQHISCRDGPETLVM